MNIIRVLCLSLASFCLAATAQANRFDYQLSPKKIAENTYVFVGKLEDFSLKNGGNIVNTGFIVTNKGVVVIDTGSSFRYGKQMINSIREITDQPIVKVFNTHHHPDHYLGNQAFPSKTLTALKTTINEMKETAEPFTDNVYRMTGSWMKGTNPTLPVASIEPGPLSIGEHRLQLIALSGHTGADLAIFDQTTGVLFASDLVFNKRAATTPHANIGQWVESLAQLEKIPFKILVPGHGPIATNSDPIAETRDYIQWVDHSIKTAAQKGLDMVETMQLPVKQSFPEIDLVELEFTRSVSHLFMHEEDKILQPTSNNVKP